MRVYLDACYLQRPFDDRAQPRINIEAEAVLTILRLVEAGQLELVSSEALMFELDRMPDLQRKARAVEILALAGDSIELNDEIERLAGEFVRAGVMPLDALHLVSASRANAKYFCTCDDKLLNRSRGLAGLATEVVSPLRLGNEVT